jgi:hypothetical protein
VKGPSWSGGTLVTNPPPRRCAVGWDAESGQYPGDGRAEACHGVFLAEGNLVFVTEHRQFLAVDEQRRVVCGDLKSAMVRDLAALLVQSPLGLQEHPDRGAARSQHQ